MPGGLTSTWAHDKLRAGGTVTLAGPYGTFLPDPEQSGPVLLLAAGSGMAPARALAEALLAVPRPRPVTLFFSARSRADTIDHARWQEWVDTHKDFRYLLTLTREPQAPLHAHIPELLAGTFRDLAGWEVFASGPPGFVTGCAAAAEALGAERSAIHTEEFFADPQPWSVAPPVAARGAKL